MKIVRYLDRYVEYSMRLAKVGKGDLAGRAQPCDFLCGGAGVDVALAFDIAGARLTSGILFPTDSSPPRFRTRSSSVAFNRLGTP